MHCPVSKTPTRPRAAAPFLIALMLAGTQVDAHAFGTLNDQLQDALAVEFNKLDRNQDARLTRDEAGRDADIAPGFGSADRNHDGTLATEEYSAAKGAIQQARLEAYLEDSTVTARIKAELLKDNGFRGLAISVETLRGKVILSGFVNTEQQARRAVEIASGVRGVHSVKNGLLLKG